MPYVIGEDVIHSPSTSGTREPLANRRPEPQWGTPRGEPSLLLAFDDGGLAPVRQTPIPREGLSLGQRGERTESAPEVEILRDAGAVLARGSHGGAGARVNGRPLVGDHPLRHGDVLRLADTLWLYSLGGYSESEAENESSCAGGGWAMAAVRRSVDMVAPHRHSVVIMGETGTGKEVVARRIHQRSGRKGPFVAVNCAMLSESLMASELFGHVRGAFTGATIDQQGLFRAANHGTLLLDEMSDMPLPLQASLLRVLETATVRPVGTTRDIPVDTRIVATSNRDLIELVHADRFRADLYARLAQWTVRVPPLRERREDMQSLVRHLLTRFEPARRRLTTDLAEALLVHEWPLNVRGLFNTLSIAAITSPPGQPLGLHQEVEMALWSSRSVHAEEIESRPADVDKASIERALEQCRGRVASVARQLGLSRPRLYRMFAAHGIDPGSYRPG